jgi:RNA polymerase sigma-70 factor (ECF subfamily)
MIVNQHSSREEALLLEVGEPVRRFLARVLREPELAEDAASETMLTLIQRVRSGARLRRPVSFALQVAWTKALKCWRKARLKPPATALVAPQRPCDPARMAELRDWLDVSLAALTAADRAILHLRYELDLSYREMARVLGEPVGTIGRRLHDARNALKTSLEESSGDPVSERMLGVLLPILRVLESPAAPAPPAFPAALQVLGRSGAHVGVAQRLGLALVLVLGVAALPFLLGGPDRGAAHRKAAETESTEPASASIARSDDHAKEIPVSRSPPSGAISGRVVDGSGSGVRGARVRWTPGSPGLGLVWHPGSGVPSGAGQVACGADGGFAIADAARQAFFHLAAEAPGFAPAIRCNVRAGSTGVVLSLSEGLGLSGVVTDLQGVPIADASITYHARTGPNRFLSTTRSGATGRYRFEHLPTDPVLGRPEAATLEIDARGHARQLRPVGAAWGSLPELELDVWLPRGSTVQGVVRDAGTRAPVAGAVVEVWWNPALEVPGVGGARAAVADAVPPLRIAAATSDGAGRYRIDHVPVRTAGIEPGSRFAAAFRQSVLAGGSLAATRGPTEDHRPVPLIEPRLGSAAARQGSVAHVLAGGLVASAPDRAPAAVMVPLATKDGAVIDVDVDLWPAATLSGRVIDALGRPIAGAEASVTVEEGDEPDGRLAPDTVLGRRTLAHASADGRWSLGGLPHGDGSATLKVEIRSPAHQPSLLSVPARGDADLGDVVLEALALPTRGISAGSDEEMRDVRNALVAERVLQGTVRSMEDELVPGALVTAVARCGEAAEAALQALPGRPDLILATAVADERGRFTLCGLPAGRVRVWAGVPWPRNDGLIALLLDRAFAVLVDEPPDGQPVVVRLHGYTTRRATLRVRALDAASRAPILHDLAGSLVTDADTVGGHGVFTGPGLLVFHAVPHGRYRMRVHATGRASVTVQDVMVGAGGAPAIEVALAPGGTLRGAVRVAGDHPPPERACIRAEPGSPDLDALVVRCSDEGKFEISGMAAGEWRVSAFVKEGNLPPTMVSKPIAIVVAATDPPPLLVRLVPIQPAIVRLSGVFADGEAVELDRAAPGFGQTLGKLARFRFRCQDRAGDVWFDGTMQTLAWRVDDRDVLVKLPLPEGAYSLILDRGAARVDTRPLSSPGLVEIRIPP